MQAIASLSVIKKELQNLDKVDLIALCLKLSKSTKDNKALVHYVLYEQNDINNFIATQKEWIDSEFQNLESNVYYNKKRLKALVKNLTKVFKYAEKPTFEIELSLHFISTAFAHKFRIMSHPVITKMFITKIAKIKKLILQLHEDLQYDYTVKLENIVKNTSLEIYLTV